MKEVPFKFVDVNLSAQQRQMLAPVRQTALASGCDLACAVDSVELLPGMRKLIPCGIAIAVPPGFEAQVRSRSGLSMKHGVVVLNSPGTIDADYRGEIKVILANFSNETFTVTFGMRIAQLVIAPVSLVPLVQVLTLDESLRGSDGFGSTGLI